MAGGLLGAGFFVLAAAMLPAGPAQAAVTCDDEWELGTLSVNNDGTTNWAVSADGTDARKVCSGATDGDTLRYVDLNPPTIPAGALRVVIAVADSALNYLHMAAIADRDAVLTGTVGGGLKTGVVFIGTLRAPPEKSITLTSYADIDVSGQDSDGIGHGGIYFYNQDPAHTSLLQGINRGSVTTSGDVYAHGIHWLSDAVAASAEARVVNEGTVKTTGTGSRGVYARISNSESQASATAINRGASATITTEGDHYYDSEEDEIVGSDGLAAYNDGNGDAIATNEAGATITVEGSGARGVYAEAGKGGTALATNSGTVTSEGDAAFEVGTGGEVSRRIAGGVWAQSQTGLARAVNEAGGTVSTSGKAAYGVYAGAYGNESGNATATNRGTITTTGAVDEEPVTLNDFGSRGLVAWADAGNATAVNDTGGTITVSGAKARGIQAMTFGTGKATVIVDGGTVTASYDDTTDDANDGTAIYASTGAAGSIEADIKYGAHVKGPQAVKFENAPATLDLTRATLEGRVDFAGLDDSFTVDSGRVYGRVDMGAGNDKLTVNNSGYFDGAIDFGAGADTITVNNGGYFGGAIDFGANPDDAYDTLTLVNGGYFDGNITGLETFRGGGEIRLANVTFSGSSATFEDGSTINLTGNFHLGENGTMTIADGARINAIATLEDGSNNLPKITAGGGIACAAGNCTFFLLNDEMTKASASADDIEGGLFGTYMVDDGNGNTVTRTTAFANGTGQIVYKTEVDGEEMTLGETGVAADGTAIDVDLSQSVDLGSITLDAPPLPDVGPLPGGGGSEGDSGGGSGGGGGGGAGAVIGVGLLALLLGLFDFEPAVALSGFGPGGAADPASPKPAFVRSADGGSHYWARSLAQALPAGGAGSSGGVEFGMDVGVGNGFTLGFAAAPEVAAERSVDAQHATALSGGRYSLRGGWRGESLFAGLSVSHADWRVEGAYSNPAAGGGLHSSFDAVQNDLRLGVGARIGLGGGLALVPQAEAFAGEVDRESHMAEGADFRAAMPGLTQRYSGVKVGLGLASSWQEGPDGLKLRPSLKLSAMRARTGSQSFDLEQSHRSGLIATSSRARLADAPQTVFGLGAGLDAVSDGGLKLKFGYGVLVDDGKLHHAVAAGLKLDF